MVFVVEDDNSIRELVVYTLNFTGIPAQGFEKPSDFYAALKVNMPELVMLDLMLPEEDGLSVLQKIKSNPQTAEMPVIIVTAKGSEYDKVVGFEKGADDYIPKPFGMMELVARVKALLRRSGKDKAEYNFYDLIISKQEHTVKVNGEEISLTYKEFELLILLIENSDKVLTRDRILNDVWGYEFDGENRTVDVHIRTLRQKLGSAQWHIETVRGVGYKFIKAVDKNTFDENIPV